MRRGNFFWFVLAGIVVFVIGTAIESRVGLWRSTMASGDDSLRKSKDSLAARWGVDFDRVNVKSPLDGAIQKAYLYKTKSATPQPLVVSLHSWSFDYRQDDTLAVLSRAKDINYIHPDFRGENWNKNACCSDFVLTDIDAAIDYAITHANVDTTKIYVIGRSGGGYATLATFMKSKHRIRKFSAWVPLTDLVKWYEETRIRKLYYADNILICTHSKSDVLDKESAIQRSPFYWNTPKEKLTYATLEIFTGVYDGLENNGPIPITQSINFYNKILKDLAFPDSSQYIRSKEKLLLLEQRKPLGNFGKIGNREICLVKEASNVKITFFVGGHEMLSDVAFTNLMRE
jgi:pimeloyl-ACP methyl ester carboxylesterase